MARRRTSTWWDFPRPRVRGECPWSLAPRLSRVMSSTGLSKYSSMVLAIQTRITIVSTGGKISATPRSTEGRKRNSEPRRGGGCSMIRGSVGMAR